MKRQAVNPFLPSWECIPDGEPRRFGDRVYLYGSHDRIRRQGNSSSTAMCIMPTEAGWEIKRVILSSSIREFM